MYYFDLAVFILLFQTAFVLFYVAAAAGVRFMQFFCEVINMQMNLTCMICDVLQNVMTFNKCSINSISYGDVYDLQGNPVDITEVKHLEIQLLGIYA